MQDTNEQVENHLINIFNKKSASLPEWELLSDLAKDTEKIPVLGAVKFASIVYYAIKDLLKPIGYNRGEFIKRDNKNKTLTLKEYFLSIDSTDSTVNEKKIFNPNNLEFPKDVNFSMPDKWELFKDVDLETLNEEQKSIPIIKMDNYLIKGTAKEEIKSYLNTKEISENIDKVFLPIINSDFKHLTFEEAIKEFEEEATKQHAEPLPKVPDAIEPEETELSYMAIALIYYYRFHADTTGKEKGIPDRRIAKKICSKEYIKRVDTAPDQLRKKYISVLRGDRFIIDDRFDHIEERLNDFKSAYEYLDKNKYPEAKKLAKTDYEHFKNTHIIEEEIQK